MRSELLNLFIPASGSKPNFCALYSGVFLYFDIAVWVFLSNVFTSFPTGENATNSFSISDPFEINPRSIALWRSIGSFKFSIKLKILGA